MSIQNTSHSWNGEILTGKLWRVDNEGFHKLPFYTNIPRMDEMAEPLQNALKEGSQEGCYREMLVVRFLQFIVPNNMLTFDRNWAGV
jgi:hypothetical protein